MGKVVAVRESLSSFRAYCVMLLLLAPCTRIIMISHFEQAECFFTVCELQADKKDVGIIIHA